MTSYSQRIFYHFTQKMTGVATRANMVVLVCDQVPIMLLPDNDLNAALIMIAIGTLCCSLPWIPKHVCSAEIFPNYRVCGLFWLLVWLIPTTFLMKNFHPNLRSIQTNSGYYLLLTGVYFIKRETSMKQTILVYFSIFYSLSCLHVFTEKSSLSIIKHSKQTGAATRAISDLVIYIKPCKQTIPLHIEGEGSLLTIIQYISFQSN